MDEMLQIDLCNGQVRVMLCETTETVQRCADIHATTPVCTAALGRLMTGTAMLGIMMKGEEENVTVTIKGDGPMGTLVAVADMFPEKARQAAQKYGVPSACTVEELLAMDSVQIVLNLTIPAAHYSVNRQSLEAGKHVYCEKPLALRFEEAGELLKLAAEKSLMCVSAPDTFLGAGIQQSRTVLDSGKIGTPIGFTANMTCAGHELWHPNPGFYYKAGGGPMFDMGPCYLTALVYLLGPIRRISCFAKKGRPVREILGQDMPSEVPTTYLPLFTFFMIFS